MDPFTAVSLVGNSLQFIIFAKDIYKQVREVRASATGLTNQRQEILWSISQLDGIIQAIKDSFDQASETASPTQWHLCKVAEKCLYLAKELEIDIQRRADANRSNILSAMKDVIKNMWKTSELDQKVRQLNGIQDVLFKLLIVHINSQHGSLEAALADLREKSRQLEVNRTQDLKDFCSDIKNTVASIEVSVHPSHPLDLSREKLAEITSNLVRWPQRAQTYHREQQIISSLCFEGMFHRRDGIVEAHEQTCQWIYGPEVHFMEWLRSNEGVYWVAGDPGSGKSTLLKHLSTDARVDQELRSWAEPLKLVKASFYFWYTGTGIQTSQEGLFRSLLFEILCQCPSAIPQELAKVWDQNPAANHWSRSNLMKTLHNLYFQSPNIKFCFFIDGLDEYGGSVEVTTAPRRDDRVAEHVAEIIDTMDRLSKLPNIKLCLSSSVWLQFEQRFGTYSHQKLYMHDHNSGDIRRYVEDRFRDSKVFMESQLDFGQPEELVIDIVRYSRGVFLWVSLVVESLLRGLSNHDRLAELRSRLETTPRTLHGFFERMLSSVEDVYQEQAAQILLVALHTDEPLPTIMYSFIGDEEHDALTREIRAWTEEEFGSRLALAELRLRVRCPDLLKITHHRRQHKPSNDTKEVSTMGIATVEFLHRSVRDFLAHDGTQRLLHSRIRRRPFNPINYICSASLSLIKCAAVPRSSSRSWNIPRGYNQQQGYIESILPLLLSLRHYALISEQQFANPQTEVLDQVEWTIGEQLSDRHFLIGQDSFLGFMAVEGDLRHYLEMRLRRAHLHPDSLLPSKPAAASQEPRIFPHHGVGLLERALFPRPVSQDVRPSPETVSLLLDYGAELTPGIWGLFIQTTMLLNPSPSTNSPLSTNAKVDESGREMRGRSRRPSVPVIGAPETDATEAHLRIIREMLERGADPWRECSSSYAPSLEVRRTRRRTVRRNSRRLDGYGIIPGGDEEKPALQIHLPQEKYHEATTDLLEVIRGTRRHYRHRPGGELVSYLEGLIERKRREWGPPRRPSNIVDEFPDLEPYVLRKLKHAVIADRQGCYSDASGF